MRTAIFGLTIACVVFGHCVASEPTVRTDLVYGHKDGMALTMDLFEPTTEPNGVGLMLIVSGGWVSAWSPPEKLRPMIEPFLKAGYRVFAVRHGSSPKYLIPEIVKDVRLAHKYVHDRANEFKIDPKRIGVFGFSAGGHLSLMLGTTSNSEPGDNPRIAAVAAVFPPTDLRPYVDPTNPLREQFPALKFDVEKGSDYSPLLQVTKDDAPIVLVHGDRDELVPLWHSEKLVEALKKESVPTELVVIKGAAHGFDADGNRRMYVTMVSWFDKHLLASSK